MSRPSPEIAAAPDSGADALLGRLGELRVRLARTPSEIAAAQRVRHAVFFGDGVVRPRGARDADRFDAVCDHVLVLDDALPGAPEARIVGTYRLLPQDRLASARDFYSSGEYAAPRLVARNPDRRFLEVGRSCVLPAWRSKRTLELLWQGVWSYCRHTGHDVMVGCASFSGTDPERHRLALSFLFHHARATGRWAIRAVPGRRAPVALLPPERIDARAAIAAMPPLIKGYLKLGARFGEDCVIDHEFGSVDLFVVMPVEAMSPRFVAHFGADAERFAA